VARIPLRDLKPGMVLAEPVVGPGGKQLAAAGSALTPDAIQLMRSWGVEAAAIGEATAGPDPQVLLAAQRAVAPRFRGQVTDHPAIRTVFAVAVERELRRTGRA
jgi:hypothetical protein